jgi:hypothetical protein
MDRHVPYYIRHLVKCAREIKVQIGYISAPMLARKFGIKFEKAAEIIKYINQNKAH